MYTLSSPTVLATDAAAHPGCVRVLRALSSVFRISPDGAHALARAWSERDRTATDATDVAWGMVSILDLNAPSLPSTLRAAASSLDAEALAGGRFGTASQVAALVAAEAAVWPDAPSVPLGGTPVPGSAAAAAAAVAAYWASPDLDLEHVRVLRAPFNTMAVTGGASVFEHGAFVYGPQTAGVSALIDEVRSGTVTPEQLSAVVWPSGVWARAMHEAAWTCLREGRLRAQMRAVLDVTLEFVLAHPLMTAVETRACLPTLHALTVRRLIQDSGDEKSLGELSLAEYAF